VIAVKAPAETKLEVPESSGVSGPVLSRFLAAVVVVVVVVVSTAAGRAVAHSSCSRRSISIANSYAKYLTLFVLVTQVRRQNQSGRALFVEAKAVDVKA